MATQREVEFFLNDFKQKLKIWNVIFRDERGKNTQALIDLEITPAQRKKYLEDLQLLDYSEGPLRETLYKGADMWVFGKHIKSEEVYIKISMGLAGAAVLCISFHLAERKMTYPFKNI